MSSKNKKRKSIKKNSIVVKKNSVKKIWENLVKRNDSRLLLKNTWKIKNNQSEYSDKLNKLLKKYN